MYASVRNKLLLIAFLAVLSLRALTPDGYMPAAQGSGLLFELCPSAMPAEIMQALAGDSDHQHGHHDHHGADDSESVSATEQCPIGHMLASAMAADTGASSPVIPDAALFDNEAVIVAPRSTPAAYRSRAPPA